MQLSSCPVNVSFSSLWSNQLQYAPWKAQHSLHPCAVVGQGISDAIFAVYTGNATVPGDGRLALTTFITFT